MVYLTGTIAVWAAVVHRHDLAETVRSWGRDLRAERWGYAAGFVVLAAVAVTRLTYSPILNLADQTPLRYWADGLEIADAHRIPALSLQWGRLFPSTVSKVVLNAFSAAGSLVLGRGPLGPMEVLLVVGVDRPAPGDLRPRSRAGTPAHRAARGAGAVRQPRPGAPSLTDDLVNYRAETWGRLLVVAALALSVGALREHQTEGSNRRELVAAGVCSAWARGRILCRR